MVVRRRCEQRKGWLKPATGVAHRPVKRTAQWPATKVSVHHDIIYIFVRLKSIACLLVLILTRKGGQPREHMAREWQAS